MGLFSKIKNMFGGSITGTGKQEYLVEVVKDNATIKLGKNLTVEPNFVAVLVTKGKTADVFVEGTYRLETTTMPILTRIAKLTKPNKKGVLPSKFKADIYFVNLKQFENIPFYSADPVIAKGKDYKDVRVDMVGEFGFEISSPVDFIEALATQYGLIKNDIAIKELSNWVANLAVKKVQKNKPNIELLHDRSSECFEGLIDYVNKELSDCGVKINNIQVTKTIFPKKIYKNVKLDAKEVFDNKSQQNKNDYLQQNNVPKIEDEVLNSNTQTLIEDENKNQYDISQLDIQNLEQNADIDYDADNVCHNMDITAETTKQSQVEYKRCMYCGAFNPTTSSQCFSCKNKL